MCGVCSRELVARTPKRSRWIRTLRPGRCNGSSSRLPGIKKNCETVASRSSPEIMLIPMRLAALTKQEPPRVATRPPVSNGNTMAIAARLKTVSTMLRWRIQLPALIACWMPGCIFPRSGLMIRCVEKKLHSRRGSVQNETANRDGSDWPRAGQRDSGHGVERG